MLKPNQVLPLLMLFLLYPASWAFAEDAEPTLEFRLADDSDTSGWQRMEVPGSDEPIFVSGDASLNGGHIEKVSFGKDPNGVPSIGFTLTDDGAKAMKATTSQNVNKRLAIVLNGKVVSAPTIRSTITTEGVITGRFSKDDLLAFFHAMVLRDMSKVGSSHATEPAANKEISATATAGEIQRWSVQLEDDTAVLRASKSTKLKFVTATIASLQEAGADTFTFAVFDPNDETDITGLALSVNIVDDVAEVTAAADLPYKVLKSLISQLKDAGITKIKIDKGISS